MSRLLIDAGPSLRGWSYYGDFFRCRHLWALKRLAHVPENADPLTRGSMGHVGLAHHFARGMAKQRGTDPDMYYTPEGAVEEWCARHPEGIPHFSRVIEVTRRYIARHPEMPGTIVGVEHQVVAVLGTHASRGWGLWVIGTEGAASVDFGLSWRPDQPRPRAVLDGAEVEPTLLVMPGHRDHGAPILLTRRIDLSVADRAGIVMAWDHKVVAQAPSKDRAKKYSMDGQFAVTRIMASQMFPRFAGAKLNLVQSQEPWNIGLLPVPPTPWRDGRFAVDLYRAAHEIAQLERDEPNPHNWPMAQHELVCAPRYGDHGLCPMYDACAFGAS